MQKLFLLLFLFSIGACKSMETNRSTSKKDPQTLVDQRDQQTYKIAKYGETYWMVNNLNYALEGSYCYNDSSHYCETYGRMYTWEQAAQACPEGWGLPTRKDWKALIDLYGGLDNPKTYDRLLKGGDSGFQALLGGVYLSPDEGLGWNIDTSATYWTSGYISGYQVWTIDFGWKTLDGGDSLVVMERMYYDNANVFASCRCVQKTNIPEMGQLVDERDGNIYKTVKIGQQIWLAENLNFAVDEGGYCAEADESDCLEYGRAYTWEAAQIACPKGWHLPSLEEWETLADHYDGIYDQFLEKGTGEAAFQALAPYGSSGFHALLAGYRDETDGRFHHGNAHAYFWASDDFDNENGYRTTMDSGYARFAKGFANKEKGYSCRCVQDK